ncbi:hypothetical protein BHM03_00050251 [Ensete ventricosum]|nr:hypothetical protein BHM03_00050251 [Ensete ventricosum]
MVSRAGLMSSTSSHSESRSVVIMSRRSRVLDRPSEDSRSTTALSSSGGAAPTDSIVIEALAALRSCFNVDSIITTHQLVEGVKDMNEAWLAEADLSPTPRGMLFLFVYHAKCVSLIIPCRVEMFNLGKMKSSGGAGSGSTVPSATGSVAKGRLLSSSRMPQGAPLGSPLKRGRSWWSSRRLSNGGILSESCVMWRIERERTTIFASIMTQLMTIEDEDPLVLRWSAISESSQVWTEGPLSEEYLRGALHPNLAKQVYECSSEELMNRVGKSTVWNQHERILALRATNKELKLGANQELVATIELHVKGLEEDINKLRVELEFIKNQRRELEQEVGVLRSNLDRARNDRARVEGDVLSLTEAVTLLQVELKVEGPKAVAAYKASQGFESSLEKMGRVSYEFGYRVVLERLRGKHTEIAIE